jgi:hypothetical protein
MRPALNQVGNNRSQLIVHAIYKCVYSCDSNSLQSNKGFNADTCTRKNEVRTALVYEESFEGQTLILWQESASRLLRTVSIGKLENKVVSGRLLKHYGPVEIDNGLGRHPMHLKFMVIHCSVVSYIL